MKATINRCDICGADHAEENPVEVVVAMRPAAGLSALFGGEQPVQAIDLCRACTGTFYEMLMRRRSTSKAGRPKAANKTEGDALDMLRRSFNKD